MHVCLYQNACRCMETKCHLTTSTCTNLCVVCLRMCSAAIHRNKKQPPLTVCTQSCQIWVTLSFTPPGISRGETEINNTPLSPQPERLFVCVHYVHAAADVCLSAPICMSCLCPCDLTCTIDQSITSTRGWCLVECVCHVRGWL